MGVIPPPSSLSSKERSRWGNWLIAALAALTVALGISAALAPVIADDPVVTWPEAGQEPTSTVLPLSPYRPLSLDAHVPCTTLRAVNANSPQGGTALSTRPNGAPGMEVSARGGEVLFRMSGREVFTEPIPDGGCTYRVLAGSDGVRVLRDGDMLARAPELLPPQVAELATDAEGMPQASGLAVELHTDARYQSRPTALKVVLLTAHGLALATLLVVTWRRWRDPRPSRTPRLPRPGAADAVMVLVAAAWVFLSPANMDDGWYLMMARNAGESGYIGNFVYMFNVTENPFVLSQYMLQLWGELGGWSLWWMRLVPTLCGLATWALLRVLMTVALGRAGTMRTVPWALLVAFLVWYLPYGVTLRPEPVIVMCAAATLVFAELAVLRHSIGALAVATICAALAVTASPSGVVAAAPLLLSLPWLVRWLRQQSWSARVGAVTLAVASATVVVPIGFADATLGDALEAIDVHQWYYLSFAWYEEFVHYDTLINSSTWARRLPVLLTLGVLVVVALSSGRGGTGRDPVRRLVLVSAITTSVALVLIALSPTKWVNHFHAVAAAPTVLLAAVLLRSPLPRRAGPMLTGASLLALVGTVSLSYAGPNWWIPFTDAGQRFGNHLDPDLTTNNTAPHISELYLRNPAPWLAVAALAWAWGAWRRSRGKLVLVTPDRAVVSAASLGSVLLMVALFAYAPIGQAPGWTVARSGVRSMFGGGCGLSDAVRVQLPAEKQLLPPATPPATAGDFGNDRPLPVSADPWPRPVKVWHDDLPDGTTTGTGQVTTGWYPLPKSTTGTHVTVPVAGSLANQGVEVQFGQRSGDGWAVASSESPASDLRRPPHEWQQLSVPLPADRPGAVRVVVTDRVTGANSWVTVAEPELTAARPITELTSGKAVLANHIAAGLWPCVNQVDIDNGITETPRVRMTVDDLLPPGWPDNISNLTWGGAWMQTARSWTQTELHAELHPKGPPRKPWGHVFAIDYPHPTGRYDLRVEQNVRWGWERLPTLADNDYPNIENNAGTQVEEPTSDS
ncbi:energy-converting hydrogenase Eha subunit E [Saccharopolyspora lacisalsi]|uniref:Energy-converting hydrogenase Eha subunit E n=2 Tax=Halosaccharopolyspora lacisalsi TaxID=1000566 RepID=A0A839E120_9PSEU|nr:energy-converting hydrogenase Eha subunit E [Halosaccharopolyspora lacisalsi]